MGRRTIVDLEKRIYRSLFRMSARDGFGNISTRDLSKRIGISEPVIFSHFLSKQGLLDASFSAAWIRIYTYFQVPASWVNTDFMSGFALFKSNNDLLLEKFTDEILYAYDYLNSSSFNASFASLVMKDTLTSLKHYFALSDPQLNEDDLDLIANQNLHLSLRYLTQIARGRIKRTERSDAIYYTLRHTGYLALKETNLDLFENAEKKDR
jgi:AcrR family transcriptional regulator